MQVNIDKSKVMWVFSMQDNCRKEIVEIVDTFSYLGFILHYNNKFTIAKKTFSRSG